MTENERDEATKLLTVNWFNDFEERLPISVRILISFSMELLLAVIVYSFHISNPNMILVTGLVASSALLGVYGGVTAAIVMLAYTFFFFSSNHDFVTFEAVNQQKVIVSTIGILAITGTVCFLKREENDAFRRIKLYMEMLKKDNELLEEATTVDPLTGIRNRFSLRRDYDQYIGKSIHVMMMDLDNFKQINDTCGHDVGDSLLKDTGKLLSECFGNQYSYRYGGDEFLVIQPDVSETSFAEECRKLQKCMGRISISGHSEHPHFSAGYVYGKTTEHDNLRQMIKQADEQLYTSKNAGKDKVQGTVFRAAAIPASH